MKLKSKPNNQQKNAAINFYKLTEKTGGLNNREQKLINLKTIQLKREDIRNAKTN